MYKSLSKFIQRTGYSTIKNRGNSKRKKRHSKKRFKRSVQGEVRAKTNKLILCPICKCRVRKNRYDKHKSNGHCKGAKKIKRIILCPICKCGVREDRYNKHKSRVHRLSDEKAKEIKVIKTEPSKSALKNKECMVNIGKEINLEPLSDWSDYGL